MYSDVLHLVETLKEKKTVSVSFVSIKYCILLFEAVSSERPDGICCINCGITHKSHIK